MNNEECPESTIVVIGNGFDKSHGLKTSYDEFVSCTKHSSLMDFGRLKEYYYRSEYDIGQGCISNKNKDVSWTDFERVIGSVTNLMTRDAIENKLFDYYKLKSDIVELNQSFEIIRDLLMKYLSDETDNKLSASIVKPKYKEYIKKNTPVINFNYTATAELYSQNIYYIHGSLKEKSIVLGYDWRQDFDVEEQIFTIWDKRYRREELGLKRFVSREGISLNPIEYNELLSDFRVYHEAMKCRGIDNGLKKELRYFDLIHWYTEEITQFGYGFDFDLSQIKKIVFIGHSLFADEKVMISLLRGCNSLKNIVLFRRDEDGINTQEARLKFLREHCKSIELVDFPK